MMYKIRRINLMQTRFAFLRRRFLKREWKPESKTFIQREERDRSKPSLFSNSFPFLYLESIQIFLPTTRAHISFSTKAIQSRSTIIIQILHWIPSFPNDIFIPFRLSHSMNNRTWSRITSSIQIGCTETKSSAPTSGHV